jgi:MFS family permease
VPPHRIYYGWVIVGVMWLVSLASQASATFTFGLFVLPMSNDLGVSRAAITWLQTVRLVGNGSTSFLFGPLVDRFGPRLLRPTAAAIGGVSLILASRADEVWMLLVLFGVIGAAGVTAPNNVLINVPVAKWFIRRRGRAVAFVAFGGAAGGSIFAVVHALMIGNLGWRGTFLASGIIMIALAVPLPLLLLRRTPEDIGLLPDGDTPRPEGEPLATSTEEVWTPREALHTFTFWKILVAYMLTSFATGAFVVHRPAYWAELGFSDGLIAAVFAVDSATFAVVALATGVVLERVPARFVGVAAMSTHGLAIVLSLTLISEPAIFLTGVMIGAGAGANTVVQNTIWAQYYGRTFLGRIRGIVLPTALLGLGLGAPTAAMLYGVFGSYRPSFWGQAALLVVAAALMVFATPPRHKPRPTA